MGAGSHYVATLGDTECLVGTGCELTDASFVCLVTPSSSLELMLLARRCEQLIYSYRLSSFRANSWGLPLFGEGVVVYP